jgi:Flp pilus assembly protein protease CpaA
MFAFMIATYALGAMGGGDAKLLSVAFLWIGSANASLFCLLLAIASAAYYVLHRFGRILPGKPGPRGKTLIPYGPCIAAAWIATMILRKAA